MNGLVNGLAERRGVLLTCQTTNNRIVIVESLLMQLLLTIQLKEDEDNQPIIPPLSYTIDIDNILFSETPVSRLKELLANEIPPLHRTSDRCRLVSDIQDYILNAIVTNEQQDIEFKDNEYIGTPTLASLTHTTIVLLNGRGSIDMSHEEEPIPYVVVLVKNIFGNVWPLVIRSDDTVGDIKRRIATKIGVKKTNQRLICQGRSLEDGKPLQYYLTTNLSNLNQDLIIIYLVLRLRGPF
ncbi:hypothetical protein DFA_08147 [Cavenderia fasciculata]|uniref:Ubiquitin-like domain-containing protein n=1 Tax=Cavenderia fasciculata TaxID=261658 RepID=F4Q5A4_CACFS|nr:uncharacterized protein DFA_08147 [Cavenderia fasciculata]EGG17163.1 hypothetical protein DFA_08147 [Cavenderia fasciculata]|eukprot:XP_004355647.1 hypothetical protein DFA_08147 [Cavenderia fasciculata]